MRSSSSSEGLQERLENAKQISNSPFAEQSFVMSCLEMKVGELLKYKEEVYSLRSKLKVAMDTIQLQNAERAFYLNQTGKESIQIYSSENMQLRSNLKDANRIIEKQKKIINKLKQQLHAVPDLNSRIDQLEKQSSRYDRLIRHVESQKRMLADLLQVRDDDLASEWKNIKGNVTSLLKTRSVDRNAFSKVIVDTSALMNRQIAELYDSVFLRERTQLRTVILLVVFCKRMMRVREFPWDPAALTVFACNGDTYASKLQELRFKFAEMTQDLIAAKQEAIDSMAQKRESEKGREKVKSELLKREEQVNALQSQVMALKSRIIELQGEISGLVSAETYEIVVKEKETLACEKTALQAEVNELGNEIKRRDEVAREMTAGNAELKAKLVAGKKKEKKLMRTIAEKKKEISTLNTLIHKKNRQTLALERSVMESKAEKKVVDDNLIGITVENQCLRQTFTGLQINDQMCLSHPLVGYINPAFLGE